jgi:carbamoyltransferase
MPSRQTILGISAFYHDAAAAVVIRGEIVAAAQEERFTRKKNDAEFPLNAIRSCLSIAKLDPGALDAVVFYDKPILKFTRILETYLAVAPRGWVTFPTVISNWLGEKLDPRKTIKKALPDLRPDCEILFTQHHEAHAASAFFPSPFDRAAILTVDGVGEWATTSIAAGEGAKIRPLEEIRFPHSLGLLYSAFTAYCGFRINSGEYKLMGLAPYGEPRFAETIRSNLIDLKADGSFRLNLDYFNYLSGTTMVNARFDRLFGGAARQPDEPITQRHMDVARSIQVVCEDVMLGLARRARELTGSPNLCLAGGVALNCVANGRLWREKIFERLWVQPAAGDAGGALGAALAAWYQTQPRATHGGDAMRGALLGPAFADSEIEETLRKYDAVYRRLSDGDLIAETVRLLADEKVVAWFQGRMEFGPRALGNRSILGDARSARMQSVMNLKVKFRESFRPFAPVVRRERLADFFELDTDSPYMQLVAPVRGGLRRPSPPEVTGFERLKYPRSTIPAVTHVDDSARIQTVTREVNPRLYELLLRFEQATSSGVLINTSFNVRGEPIVCSPEDAYCCFMNTEMDFLVMGNFIIERLAQPPGRTVRRTAPQAD